MYRNKWQRDVICMYTEWMGAIVRANSTLVLKMQIAQIVLGPLLHKPNVIMYEFCIFCMPWIYGFINPLMV